MENNKTNLDSNTSQLNDQEYARLLMAAAKFLEKIDKQELETVAADQETPDIIIAMAVHYFVKELVPIPVEEAGMQKIMQASVDSKEKQKELLTLYLATELLGYQTTGQFAGLSFGATDKELYAAYTMIQTFYDLEQPHCPNPEVKRVFFYPKLTLEEKLKAAVLQRGLNQPHKWNDINK